MTDEVQTATREFLQAFEEVFDYDWTYTTSMLGIWKETAEQAETTRAMDLETIYMIEPDGTFLRPGVEDEVENWGNRARLLECYRRLKELLPPEEG